MLRTVLSLKPIRFGTRQLRYSFSTVAEVDDGEGVESERVESEKSQFPELDEQGRAYGTGRRKTASARVWVKEGSGQFIVNDRALCDYFVEGYQRLDCLYPLIRSKKAGLIDVWCTVKGGGLAGQAGAVSLGVSRALVNMEPAVRSLLTPYNLLTRDPRSVERKKAGRHKARKQYQWVKR